MRKYDAWGQYRNETAPSASEPKLGFTGHQYDPETGLVYARARYYDPEMGRFLSRDSFEGNLSDAPSLHRFTYVRGNPLRYKDPSGLREMTADEAARDAEWMAAQAQAKAAWAAMPWYRKVADFFDSSGSRETARILARNINAYREGIAQAADGEAVAKIDVAAEYGEGPGTVKLPSGDQELSRQPLIVPVSKFAAVQASRARAAATINAVRGGGVITAVTAAATRDDATIQTVAAVEAPAMALAASKMVANGIQADLRLKFQVEGTSLQGALPKPVPASAPPPEPVEYGPYYRLDTADNVARAKASGFHGGVAARNTHASDTAEAKAYVGPLPAEASGFEFYTPVAPRKNTPPHVALWPTKQPGVLKGTMGDADAAFIPIRITRDSISAPPVEESPAAPGTPDSGIKVPW
jgi:RHS repeat-associated protein